jgi:hypothetical protein
MREESIKISKHVNHFKVLCPSVREESRKFKALRLVRARGFMQRGDVERKKERGEQVYSFKLCVILRNSNI